MLGQGLKGTVVLSCRQLSAGDQLRVFYENLSKDPNSLANLDQVGCGLRIPAHLCSCVTQYFNYHQSLTLQA